MRSGCAGSLTRPRVSGATCRWPISATGSSGPSACPLAPSLKRVPSSTETRTQPVAENACVIDLYDSILTDPSSSQDHNETVARALAYVVGDC